MALSEEKPGALGRVAPRPLKVMIVAGEASSDLHAANLACSILEKAPHAEIFGMGGSMLRQAGIKTAVDSEQSASVMGFVEVFGQLGELWQAFRTLKKLALEKRPDVVVLVDFPDFNFLLARAIKRSPSLMTKTKILHFITPTIWAWRKGRIKTVKKYIDKVAPIFPFEEKFFKAQGVDAEYVGHPFSENKDNSILPEKFLRDLGLDPDKPVVGLLPGSRKAEISSLLGDMLDAFRLLKRKVPGIQAVLPVAASLKRSEIEAEIGDLSELKLSDGNASEVLQAVDAAIVASGTVTVEGVMAGCPMVVVYKLSGISYFLAKILVKGVSFFAMPNIIAGKKIIPELLQEQVTPKNMAKEVYQYLRDQERCLACKKSLAQVAAELKSDPKNPRGATAAERTATIALELAGVS